MNKALLIARWEFLSTVTRRAYIFSVVAMPLLFGIIGAIPVLSTRSAATSSADVPIALVDPAAIVDLDLASQLANERAQARPRAARPELMPTRPDGLVKYTELTPALEALNARRVAAVYALAPDYPTSGAIAVYSRSSGMFAQAFANQRQGQVVDAIRASLLQTELTGDALARAYAPAARLERFTVDGTGKPSQDEDAGALGPFAGSFIVLILLTMSIFFSAGFLQQGTVEDKQNRVMEILLSSVTAEQLLVGKLLGLGAAGLLQVGLYVVLVIVPGSTVMSFFNVPLGGVMVSLVYFALGYALFACLMAGFGMIGRTQQETAQLSALWTLAAVSPMWFIMAITAAPNGVTARALSFFPLTAPVTMIIRLSVGNVPLVDLLISAVVLIVAIYFALIGAARIFRAATLMYGKRPNLPELVRWLRAA
jgi:ABC-2 type transport system permease protein